MNKTARFLKTVGVYFAGNVLSKLVTFFLLPLYTSRLSPDQYGSYDVILTVLNLFAPLLFFQVWDGMFRRCFDFDKTQDKYKIISNAFFTCLLGASLYTVVFSTVQLIITIDHFIYILIYGLFFSLHYFYGYACRSFLNNKLFAFSGLINTIVSASCNVILIVCFGWGVESLYLSPAIGTLVQIIIIELRLKIIVNFRFKHVSRKEIGKMLKFSLPLCVSALSYWLLSGFTKVIITTVLTTYDNGLYAVANKFATMITLLVTVFQYAWNEIAYFMANDENRVNAYNTCVDILLKFVIFGGAAICLFFKIIFPFFINEQYYSALSILPATIIGVMMNSMAGFIGTFFMAEKRTSTVMISTLIAAGVNIILGFAMARYFKLMGATLALSIAFTILLIIRLLQARKNFKVKVSLKSVAMLVIVLALSVTAFYLSKSIFIDIVAIFVLCFAFLVSMRKYIKMMIGELKNKKTKNE